MFKLAKMQEALLRVSTSNVDEHLSKYKKTVVDIDTKAFNDVLEESKHIDEHNHSLEEELVYLEGIKNACDQLLELQSSFKRICEEYGDNDLELSDLSKLNIEYIENRINAIKGYLLNLKNIETNKVRLQELNEQLVDEEKNKVLIDKKLLDLESSLRNNFVSAEGRNLVDGNLQYTSVISEYKKIDLDLELLMNDNTLLEELLFNYDKDLSEALEKVKVAEICYNSMLSSESKQMLEETNLELLRVRYKVTMLKMIQLLVQNNDDYEQFVAKRESLLELIKFRLSCMEKLGTKNSIDPFGRAKVREQLDVVLALPNNSKKINGIRKEISQLNSWTEEMIGQNNNYLITLNDTRRLIEDTMGLNDIDIAPVVSFDDFLIKRKVMPNQVIKTRNISNNLNMIRVSQKTSSVIRRVNAMMNKSSNNSVLNVDEEIIPELVVSPAIVNSSVMEEVVETIPSVIENEEASIDLTFEDGLDMVIEEPVNVDVSTDEVLNEEEVVVSEPEEIVPLNVIPSSNLDLFETVNPFEEPVLFNERADSILPELVPEVIPEPVVEVTSDVEEVDVIDEVSTGVEASNDLVFDFGNNDDELMPDAFWVTDEEIPVVDNVISFDDQINALLASENKDNPKSRRKVA